MKFDYVTVNTGYVLRRLRAPDIETVGRIVAGAFGSEEIGEEVTTMMRHYCASGRADLDLDEQETEPLPSEYWVLEDIRGGKLFGISGLYRFAWAWKRSFWLGWFAVSAEEHGKGLGTLMLQSLLRIAKTKGCEVCKVETARGGRATRFYERNGFAVEGILSKHYSSQLDAQVLSRSMEDIQSIPSSATA